MSELLASNLLRTTRLEVAARIPELAPQLADNSTVVQEAVIESLEAQGAQLQSYDWPNINRTERHSYVTYLMSESKDVLVEGEGSAARFVTPLVSDSTHSQGRHPNNFSDDLQLQLERGYTTLARRYSNDWWDDVAVRYGTLGDIMRFMVGSKARLSKESISLYEALQSPTLGGQIAQLGTFVCNQMPTATKQERIQAGHDLAYLMHSQASMGLTAFDQSARLATLKVGIAYNDHLKKYVIDRSADTHNTWAEVFSRREDTFEDRVSTMKCPAHTVLPAAGAEGEVAERPTEKQDTSLVTLGHAGINLAAEHGVFSQPPAVVCA